MSFASLRRVLRAARKGLCATCSKTRYPQLEAAGSGHVGCLIYTLETIGGLIKDEHDVTALHVAARKGQIPVLIYIVENNVIEKNDIPRAKNGATPAHDAAGTGNLECLRYLLNCTLASPNDLDSNSATPLHWATQNGQLQIVQWLVADAKAPIDVMTKNGVTPFHLAAVKNHLNVLRWLVSFAFRNYPRPMKLINAKDKNGSTPVYLGAHAGNVEVVKWLSEKGGGDPTIVNRQGMAPIHAAASNGHIECVKFLFQFGLGTAPGGMRTTEGASTLHFAAAEGEIEIVQWLLSQKQCSGDERDYYQSTPLHDAAENGHLIVLKALCDHGCDPFLLDVEGNKPIDLTRKNQHSKCGAYLDSYMKRIMWSKMNGSRMSDLQPAQKIHRNTKTRSQIMDKFRNAPPHMMPINAFDEDDYSSDSNTVPKKETNSENEWVTVRDLLKADELKKLNEENEISSSPTRVQRMTEADLKRRLFEEKLAKEQEERQQKKMTVLKQQKQQEDEIRTQFMEGDDEVTEALKSFDDVLQDEQDALAKRIEKEKDNYPGQDSKLEKQLEDGIERKGSKWIAQILRKRASSLESNATKPIRRTRRGSDPNEWSIPSPPPIPNVKYLMGKHKRIQSQFSKKDVKKEIMASKWGREAYDDGNESDESSLTGSTENLSQLRLKASEKKAAFTRSSDKKLPSKTPEKQTKQPTKKVMVRQDTPRPGNLVNESTNNLQKLPLNIDEKSEEMSQQSKVTAPIAKLANARSRTTKISESDETQVKNSLPINPMPLNRQDSVNQSENYDDENDETSSEEESSEYESTESSDTDDDDADDRPIMAQNIGIHGAKIARQVMQRMKQQRYPSIFSKPIIKLDTILDIRYESPYHSSSYSERAYCLHKLHTEKRVWESWKKHIQLIKFARNQAEKMLQRNRKALLAEIFYAWVQAKNEAEVEKAEKKQKATKHHRVRVKARVLKNWKESVQIKNPKSVHQKYLSWLNIQLAAMHRDKASDLMKPLEDGSLIIAVLAHLSKSKLPRHKQNPRIKLHYQDNWKVAYQFMKRVGVDVKDFDPADLGNLHEASILNMFNSILKWADQ